MGNDKDAEMNGSEIPVNEANGGFFNTNGRDAGINHSPTASSSRVH